MNMYSVLMEGPNQALENDIVISVKVGQVPSHIFLSHGSSPGFLHLPLKPFVPAPRGI